METADCGQRGFRRSCRSLHSHPSGERSLCASDFVTSAIRADPQSAVHSIAGSRMNRITPTGWAHLTFFRSAGMRRAFCVSEGRRKLAGGRGARGATTPPDRAQNGNAPRRVVPEPRSAPFRRPGRGASGGCRDPGVRSFLAYRRLISTVPPGRMGRRASCLPHPSKKLRCAPMKLFLS